MKAFLRKCYDSIDRLPNAVNIPITWMNRNPSLVFGRGFAQYSKRLATESFDDEKTVIETANYALAKLPYYRQRYPDAVIRNIAEFQALIEPVTKEEILASFDEFVNPDVDLKAFDLCTTSGTSGKSMKIYLPKSRMNYELPTIFGYWRRYGYDFSVRGAMRMARLEKGRIFKVNPVTRSFVFRGFELDDCYFREVYKVLKRYNIQFLHCYSSNAYEFSRFIVRSGLDFGFFKAFLTSSEMVYPHQTEFITRHLPWVGYSNFYGHTEKMVLADCVASGSLSYRFDPSYGYAELVDESGRVVRAPGETGEIVATAFHNTAMPILRYRTGDWGEFASVGSPGTNRKGLVVGRILGRAGEKIYNKDRSYTTTTALTLHGDILERIEGLQYVQSDYGFLEVRIIKGASYDRECENTIKEHITVKFAPDMKIDFTYVGEFMRETNGKFLLLKSNLKSE